MPSSASAATQDALAYKLWQERGWSPWTCARIVGLPFGGSGGATATKAVVAERTTGHFDSVQLSSDGIHLTVVGWAADLNSAGRVNSVRINVNSAVTVVQARSVRADVNRKMHVSGGHGFAVAVPAVAGAYRVCLTALGNAAAHNVSLGCRTVTVPAFIPTRNRVTPSAAGVVVAGWSFDNSAAGRATSILVLVNHHLVRTLAADRPSGDVDAAFKISGSHRYSASVTLGAGRNSVCVYAVGVAASNKRFLGCTTVAVGARHS